MEIKESVELRIQDLFNFLKPGLTAEISLQAILEKLEAVGIYDRKDPRLKELKTVIRGIAGKAKCIYELKVDLQNFAKIVNINKPFMIAALLDNLVIPNFQGFVKTLEAAYENESENSKGNVTKMICGRSFNADDAWCVAICSVDGQRHFLGPTDTAFPLHALSKPFIYGMIIEKLGINEIEKYVGHEPMSRHKDFLGVDSSGRIRSPMLSSGFFALCSLLFIRKTPREVSHVHQECLQYLMDLAGNEFLQHKTQAFIASKTGGKKIRAIAHLMLHENRLPKNCSYKEACDFYHELFSMEVNCESLSLMAATLANGGINPLTQMQILSPTSIKYILSVLFTSGSYTYSGKVGFNIGNPGKTSRTGGAFFVIPGVMGIALYSPRIDEHHNSVRAMSFMENLVKDFQLHPNASLTSRVKKRFPSRKSIANECNSYCEIFSAVVTNDMPKVVRLCATEKMSFAKDHDKRTILHVAAALGHQEIVKHLVSKYSNLISEKDRWGRTALDYAKRCPASLPVVDMLKEWEVIMQASSEQSVQGVPTNQNLLSNK